jgi:hypothetical protein
MRLRNRTGGEPEGIIFRKGRIYIHPPLIAFGNRLTVWETNRERLGSRSHRQILAHPR